ncbi:MAG: family 43 glycosylhydrolase [Bacteroidales bacterium]
MKTPTSKTSRLQALTIPASLLLGLIIANPTAAGQTAPETQVVIRGDFPDPSILREGDTYYMVHSSYDFFPGLLIWKSKDLLHWERATRALQTHVGNVWAPDLVKHQDLFYLYFPTDRGGNYVITAKHPEGPWSDPVHIDVTGIDPGHIATPDGKRFLYLNNGRVAPLAPDGLSVTGEMKQVYEGWIYPLEWGVECFCLESPKLIYREPYYYMTSAQGGTSGPATSHMAVAARSKSPTGPWEDSPHNPVVKTWKASEPWWSKGHGTIFASPRDQWFIVYHAYENGHLPMGRSTLIEPIEWTADGWYRSTVKELNYQVINNNQIRPDDFSKPELDLQWSFSGITRHDQYQITGGRLIMQTDPEQIRVLHAIPGNPDYEASVCVIPDPGTEAGLIVYFTDDYYAGLGIKDGVLFSLFNGRRHWGAEVRDPAIKYLKFKLDHYTMYLSYSRDGIKWEPYEVALEVSGYQKNVLGGFSSLKTGIYGKGGGKVMIDDFN